MKVLDVEDELRRLGCVNGRRVGFSIVDMLVALSASQNSSVVSTGPKVMLLCSGLCDGHRYN